MDATQMISDSVLESDEEENEAEHESKRGRPLAKLCILKNKHMTETEFPLFLGDNVLGRDPNTCTLLLPASSVSKQHATICLSVYRRRDCHNEVDMEALVWDLGSMNGTRKGHLKLTPNVRYALSEGDSVVVADIPCQYVSCAADSSQEGMRTPVSRNSGVKARLPHAPREKEDNTNTDSEKCVSGSTKATVPLKKTPVRASCLTFEQTPHQPQGTLVPESDSDSESEKWGQGERRRKALMSDSDSHKSSPSSSSFLSPTNKIVPESEDESPISPSSSTKNKPYRNGSFTTEETDVDVGRQQLEKKKAVAFAEDSEEEGMEEERAAQGGTKSKEGGQHVPVKEGGNVSFTGDNELSTSAVSTDAVPAFNLDSDTDVEGVEGEMASAGPVTLNTNQQVGQLRNTVQFQTDSDTDIDEDEDASVKASKALASSDESTKTPCAVSVIQPEGITMDSDTDVDEDAVVSDTATKVEPTLFQSAHTAVSASSVQPKDFNLDSDTDVDEEEEEEEEGELETKNKNSKMNETPNKLNAKLTAPECAPAAPNSLHLESDTDDEAITAPATSKPSVVATFSESCTTTNAGADLDILSDSDTDVEDESPLVIPVAVTTSSVCPGPPSEALQTDSDADTDVDESSMPPAGDGTNPTDLRVESDIEDKKSVTGEAGEDKIPHLHRENTPGMLVPLQQNCSTPIQLSVSEGKVEDMETQAFMSPSSGAFRRTTVPAVRPVVLSPSSDSQEDQDFVVAETQSFIFQSQDHQSSEEPTQAFLLESSGDNKDGQSTRGKSFKLGLSDSIHFQHLDQALALESTQAFVSVDGGVNLEDTQPYAAIKTADRSSAENDLNLEATQDYGEDEETDRCSVVSEKESQVELALEATQVYISEPHCDLEDENEDEKQNNTISETQPSGISTSSTLALVEMQPVPPFEGQENLATENPVCSIQQIQPVHQKEDDVKEAQPQEKHLNEPQSVTETQPMCTSDNDKSDDEDSFPGPRKRKAKPLLLEEEQTQHLTCSELSLSETQPMRDGVDETQPMATCEDDDDEDSIPGPRKRKAKQLHLEEEELTHSDLSAAETQPMATCETDDEDSMPGFQKRRAKQLEPEEQTQPLTGSEVSSVKTQPLGTCESEQSDVEDLIVCPQKRKAKPLQLEEEQTQPLTSTSETLAVVTGKGGDSEDENSIPGPRKRKAKQMKLEEKEAQQLNNSEVSTVETQPLETETALSSSEECEAGTSGACVQNLRETRARLREEEEQAECSAPSKRQIQGMSRKDLCDDDNDKDEVKRARGKKIMKPEKHEDDEEDKLPGRERNKHAVSNSPIKEQEDDELGEEKEAAEFNQVTEINDKERRVIGERKKETDEIERQHRKEEKNLNEKERLQTRNAERAEKERLEREIKENEESKRIESEKVEREEKERLEREQKEQEKEIAKRELEERLEKERKDQEHQARLEREAKEKEEREKLDKEKEAKEKQLKALQKKTEEQEKPKTPTRGRRAVRRTTASKSTAEPEQDSTVSTNDDFPARRTRSHSNSSNSVSSERSASSVNIQESKGRGRGRGRGAKRTSELPQTSSVRSSRRRTIVTAETTVQDSNDMCPQDLPSQSNLSNSLNSEISRSSVSSQNRGRGGRQRGRGRKTEQNPDCVPSISQNQSNQNLSPTPTTRGKKSRKAEESSNEVLHEDDKNKGSQQATSTRGQQQASAATDEEDQSKQEEGSEESLTPKRNVRGRGQKAVRSKTVEAPAAPMVSDSDEPKDKRKGRSELEANAEADFSRSKRKSPKTEAAEEEGKNETKDEIPATSQGKKRGRASTSHAKKNSKESFSEVEEKEMDEKMEVETVQKTVRGRPSVVSRKKKEELEESGTSLTPAIQVANVKALEQPHTPASKVTRKRQAPTASSPVAKTPRSSSASPATTGRLRAPSQAYKVLFTGVVDEAGEKVLARLGGSMAKGVADMNCLVTDKVRRTVKFLCALAKGVPIVTTDWLEMSGKMGTFLSPAAFIVKDPEQENKFNFSLHESIRTASSQPLLQGYEVHVTKSVKPEPVHMRDIISSSGATFLPKMPSSNKPHTVVISCEEDWPLCHPALSASLPVVTAEFILTGILQQKLDFQSHTLSPSTTNLKPAVGKGRGRRKT